MTSPSEMIEAPSESCSIAAVGRPSASYESNSRSGESSFEAQYGISKYIYDLPYKIELDSENS